MQADPMVATLMQGKSPEELMDDLGEFCSYRVEEWWTYELCYKKAARQYHTENGKVLDSYVLGNFSSADSNMITPAVDAEAGGDVKYIKQMYLGGAPCELTGVNRTVEVRFICGRAGQTVLSEIREPQSCAYVFIVSSPRLCKHPAFQDIIPAVAPIACYPVEVQEDICSTVGGEEVCSRGKKGSMEELKPIPHLENKDLGETDANSDHISLHTASDTSNNSSSSSMLEEDGAVDGVNLDDVFGNDEIIP
jgi:Glucosidase II beta subunit-like protein